MVGAAEIDRDLGKAVGILVPEGLAPRPVGEGARPIENAAGRDEPSAWRQGGRPEPRHGVAEMVDVDDGREIVGPIGPHQGAIVDRSAGRRLAAGDHRGHRRKEVAPMKAGRQGFRTPDDLDGPRRVRAAPDEFEEAAARADENAPVGLHHDRRPLAAHSGIDDAEEHGPFRKPRRIGRQQIGRGFGVAHRRVGKEVDHLNARRHPMQHRLHLAGVRPFEPEIGKERDHSKTRRSERTRSSSESL